VTSRCGKGHAVSKKERIVRIIPPEIKLPEGQTELPN